MDAGVSRYWADKIEAYISELLPKRYRTKLLHHVPTMVSEYRSENGVLLQDISLHETRNGELMMTAIVDGKEKRHLLDKKSKTFQEIQQTGWIHLSKDDLLKYILETLKL